MMSTRYIDLYFVLVLFLSFVQVLFDCIRESAEDPSNAEKHAFCKTKLRMHFDYEEGEFCKVEGYDCYGKSLQLGSSPHHSTTTTTLSGHWSCHNERDQNGG